MDVSYRRPSAADWAELRDARLAALAEAPYAFASTLERERAFPDDVWRERAGGGRTVAAWQGDAIVGMATVLPRDHDGPASGRRPYSDSTNWHLVGMWASPDVRGKDVARRLMADACALARQSGAKTMTLWVTEVNDRARAFYRKVGFRPTGARQLVRPEEPDHWEEELGLRLDQASAGAGASTGKS